MAKWEEAWYLDRDGRWVRMAAAALEEDGILAMARTLVLWSDREQRVRLHARRPGHFYAIAQDRRVPTIRAENDPLHNRRRDYLLTWLTRRPSIAIGPHVRGEGFVNHLDLSGYAWATEVWRATEARSFRHDLGGRSSILSDSIHRPEIIIEVIHHHFPDTDLFDHMIAESRWRPCIYLFDMARAWNYLLKAPRDEADMHLQYTICVRDGAVYNGLDPTEIASADDLRSLLEDRLPAAQR